MTASTNRTVDESADVYLSVASPSEFEIAATAGRSGVSSRVPAAPVDATGFIAQPDRAMRVTAVATWPVADANPVGRLLAASALASSLRLAAVEVARHRCSDAVMLV